MSVHHPDAVAGVSLTHVPMALSVQGSTLISVAQSIVDTSSALGIASTAILSHNRDVSIKGAELRYVDYTRNCPREWFTKQELATDMVAGALGLTRPYYGRVYDPAIEAVSASEADVTLLYEGHYASATLPRWAAVRKKSTLVLYCHNPLSRSYRRRELRRLLAQADVVAFCADHLRRDVEERLNGDLPSRLMTVHNGIDPAFKPAPQPPTSDVFTVVFAGITSPHKGPHLALEAVHLASQRVHRPLRLQIFGSHSYGHGTSELTEYERSLRSKADTMQAQVEFHPFVPKSELSERLRLASVACLPSQWAEGLPLIALESMASGLPVITSDSVGMVEAVGESGFVIPGGDAEGMAEVIVTLAESETMRSTAAQKALIRAQAFSWEHVARTFAALRPRGAAG